MNLINKPFAIFMQLALEIGMNVLFLYVLYLTNIYNQKNSLPKIHPLLLSVSTVRAKFGLIFGHKPC
jgi:hypothetical protein